MKKLKVLLVHKDKYVKSGKDGRKMVLEYSFNSFYNLDFIELDFSDFLTTTILEDINLIIISGAAIQYADEDQKMDLLKTLNEYKETSIVAASNSTAWLYSASNLEIYNRRNSIYKDDFLDLNLGYDPFWRDVAGKLNKGEKIFFPYKPKEHS